MLFLKLSKRIPAEVLGTALFVIFLSPINTEGQSNASIQGEILDQNGAVISGVKVTARSEAIGLERTTLTDSEGRYSIAALPVGITDSMPAGEVFKRRES